MYVSWYGTPHPMSIDEPSTAMRRVPVGLFQRDRAVVHAERIGQERLAEEVARQQRLELELEEVVVQVAHHVGFAEAHPAGRFARCIRAPDRRAMPSLPPIKPS